MSKLHFRNNEDQQNQSLETSKMHQTSMSKRIRKHVDKKFNKSFQQSPKMVPRPTQEDPKTSSHVDSNFKNNFSVSKKAVQDGCLKQRRKNAPKINPVLASEREAR